MFKQFGKMNFDDLRLEYFIRFKESVPILTTLSTDNPRYLAELKKAIDNNKPIDRNYLGRIFMKDKNALY